MIRLLKLLTKLPPEGPEVAWVPVVSLECHVAPAVASMPPFHSRLLCYSSLCSCVSTSVKHGLAVLGAWSYHSSSMLLLRAGPTG